MPTNTPIAALWVVRLSGEHETTARPDWLTVKPYIHMLIHGTICVSAFATPQAHLTAAKIFAPTSTDNRSQAVWDRLSYTKTVPHATNPLTLIGTSVWVCFSTVAFLQSCIPASFVFCSATGTQSTAVATFETMSPLTSIAPPTFVLDT